MTNSNTNLSSNLQVAIVGGSIAGCACAIELIRSGCNVTLFERSGDELKDRGAGLGIPSDTVDMFIERNLVDRDLPRFSVPYFYRIYKSDQQPRLGYRAWDQRTAMTAVNWGELYRNLRKRVPDSIYNSNRNVIAIEEKDSDNVILKLDNGEKALFDLVICADGYSSLGRTTLYPQIELQYAGYVLWRGFINEAQLRESEPLETGIHCTGFPGGHGIFYLVPGADGSVDKGKRLVNWGVYLSIDEQNLGDFLTDKTGRQHHGSLPPGAMPIETELKMKARVLECLPTFYSEITEKSIDTFAYVISDCEVPAYRKGRVCLVGDAGAFARPHSGAGALKGVNDAVALGASLRSNNQIEESLDIWSSERSAVNNELARFGNQLGRALVKEIPDWSKMNAKEMEQWYSSIVTIKSNYYIVGES